MYTTLKNIMLDNNIPLYAPTDKDHQILNNWKYLHPDINTLEGKLYNLVTRIYGFDYYYDYSDDGNVYRTWSRAERDITLELEQLEDQDLADVLTACRSAGKAKYLVDIYPWLNELHTYSYYATFLKDGMPEEEVVVWLGLHDWVKELGKKVANNGGSGHLLYAADHYKAIKLVREKVIMDIYGSYALRGLTMSKGITSELSTLSTLLTIPELGNKLKDMFYTIDFDVIYSDKYTLKYIEGFYILG